MPTVSIGAQESQLFLARGTSLAKRLLPKRLRTEILPVTLGFPFGFSVFFLPPNLPLPTKVVTQVLEPSMSLLVLARTLTSPRWTPMSAR